MKRLPDCDEVFEKFFRPWYEPEDMTRRVYTATRPDAEGIVVPSHDLADAGSLFATEAGATAVQQLENILEAAQEDWPKYINVSGPVSIQWIEQFDRYWTRPRVLELLNNSEPKEFSNDLLVICCEFGAVLGHVMHDSHPQLKWLYDWPYWESALLDLSHGYRINVFHWAIKRFSEYGIEDGYVEKLRKCLSLVDTGWDA